MASRVMGVDVDFLCLRPLRKGAGVWAAGPAGEGAGRRGQAGGGAPAPRTPGPAWRSALKSPVCKAAAV